MMTVLTIQLDAYPGILFGNSVFELYSFLSVTSPSVRSEG